MRIHFSPFGVISNKILLAVLFSLMAFGILFFEVIIKLMAVCLLGVLGYMVGSVIDDRSLLAKWKWQIKRAFSKRA